MRLKTRFDPISRLMHHIPWNIFSMSINLISWNLHEALDFHNLHEWISKSNSEGKTQGSETNLKSILWGRSQQRKTIDSLVTNLPYLFLLLLMFLVSSFLWCLWRRFFIILGFLSWCLSIFFSFIKFSLFCLSHFSFFSFLKLLFFSNFQQF